MIHKFLISAIIVIVCNIVCKCNPVSLSQFPSDLDTYKYLERFGYLAGGFGTSESLYREDAVADAIRELQRYGNIYQTGVIDEPTIQLMKTPRCGVKDILPHDIGRIKRYTIGPGGWNKRNLTYFIANWSPKLTEDSVANDMQKAFRTWAGYGNLNFKRIWSPEADIIIGFGTGYHGDYYPFDGRGNILAHAYYPYEMGAYGGDIHFDDDEQWTPSDKYNSDIGDVDFYSVAVHELGHSLGLAHSPVAGSVMYPFYRGNKEYVQLAYDDILAMHELYIARIIKEQPTESTTDSSTITFYEDENEVTNIPKTDIGTTEMAHTTTEFFPSTTVLTYIGDYETVEDHLGHEDKYKGKSNPEQSIPDLCSGNVDAMALIRDELFVFVDEFLWRMRFLGVYSSHYPIKFREFFPKLPESIRRIDAIYERPTDFAIILFTGDKYWVFDGDDFINSPRPLTDFGISSTIKKIDAVQVWKKNGKTYLYSGDVFWRYNEANQTMDNGYPKSMDRWRGIPTDLDAALTWTNGLTYFFKGHFVWRFNNYRIKVDLAYPQLSLHHWFGCPRNPGTQYSIP